MVVMWVSLLLFSLYQVLSVFDADVLETFLPLYYVIEVPSYMLEHVSYLMTPHMSLYCSATYTKKDRAEAEWARKADMFCYKLPCPFFNSETTDLIQREHYFHSEWVRKKKDKTRNSFGLPKYLICYSLYVLFFLTFSYD